MSIKAAKAANIQKQKLILMKVHSTIFNYDFFHNRCVIDEELASAIKDEEGLQIWTLKEFNLVLKKLQHGQLCHQWKHCDYKCCKSRYKYLQTSKSDILLYHWFNQQSQSTFREVSYLNSCLELLYSAIFFTTVSSTNCRQNNSYH